MIILIHMLEDHEVEIKGGIRSIVEEDYVDKRARRIKGESSCEIRN